MVREIKFFISRSFPINFTRSIGINISDDQSLKSINNCISILIEINLSNLESIERFQDAFFGASLTLDEDLTWRDII